jgi:hypothetical protein
MVLTNREALRQHYNDGLCPILMGFELNTVIRDGAG